MSIDDVAFDPIERETVSAKIRDQLFRRITTGELAPGQQMPSERDLAEQFQVARTSVREAMQGLLSVGAVARRGNRSYVAEHLPEVIVATNGERKAFVRQLFETRKVLEAPIFELAAVRADDTQRERIRTLVARFNDDLGIDEFRKLDREFHTTVASACGNALLIELYGKVLDQIFRSNEFESLLGDAQNQQSVTEIIADSCAAHRAIAAALVAGDSAGTRHAAMEHVGAVEQSMLDDLV